MMPPGCSAACHSQMQLWICSYGMSEDPFVISAARKTLLDFKGVLVLQIGRGLAQSVQKWYQHGLIHRDLSASNVGLTPDGRVLIWDFYTMSSVHLGPEESTHLIGTPLYMAISVQQGAAPSLSSELESIFYILVKLSSEDGMVYWQRSRLRDTDAKIAAMMLEDNFYAKVKVESCLHLLRA